MLLGTDLIELESDTEEEGVADGVTGVVFTEGVAAICGDGVSGRGCKVIGAEFGCEPEVVAGDVVKDVDRDVAEDEDVAGEVTKGIKGSVDVAREELDVVAEEVAARQELDVNVSGEGADEV